jgi:hypothetical protein
MFHLYFFSKYEGIERCHFFFIVPWLEKELLMVREDSRGGWWRGSRCRRRRKRRWRWVLRGRLPRNGAGTHWGDASINEDIDLIKEFLESSWKDCDIGFNFVASEYKFWSETCLLTINHVIYIFVLFLDCRISIKALWPVTDLTKFWSSPNYHIKHIWWIYSISNFARLGPIFGAILCDLCDISLNLRGLWPVTGELNEMGQ